MGTQYTVRQGDCLSSIADIWGFADYTEIYQHAENTGFRDKRPNPNIIFPGDVLVIPDRNTKEVPCATDRRHTFVMTQPKVLLRLCLQDDLHQPYADTRYLIRIGKQTIEGTTDGNGLLEHRIPARAASGEITIYPTEDDPYTFPLNLGHLDPVDEDAGVDGRLINLGFGPPDQDSGELSEEDRREALRLFQQRYGLEVTGEPDDTTRAKLREIHDGE